MKEYIPATAEDLDAVFGIVQSSINEIYPPKNGEQLNKLISQLLNLYNNSNNNNDKILNEKGFHKYEDIIQMKLISLESYLKEFLKFEFEEEINFEWSTKTYKSYGFFYRLEDNTLTEIV